MKEEKKIVLALNFVVKFFLNVLHFTRIVIFWKVRFRTEALILVLQAKVITDKT